MAKLDTHSANVAEGSGENLPAILGPRSVANMRAIQILQKSNEKMVIPSSDMHGPFLIKGAR
eukprot:4069754-Pyramimonas_sp.AAC.1